MYNCLVQISYLRVHPRSGYIIEMGKKIKEERERINGLVYCFCKLIAESVVDVSQKLGLSSSGNKNVQAKDLGPDWMRDMFWVDLIVWGDKIVGEYFFMEGGPTLM